MLGRTVTTPAPKDTTRTHSMTSTRLNKASSISEAAPQTQASSAQSNRALAYCSSASADCWPDSAASCIYDASQKPKLPKSPVFHTGQPLSSHQQLQWIIQ